MRLILLWILNAVALLYSMVLWMLSSPMFDDSVRETILCGYRDHTEECLK
jgi:hypothetical protein